MNGVSYFVIMQDFGRDTTKSAHGLEAVVDPEMTRRGAIEKVREILGDQNEIAFIHEINNFGDGHMTVSDVTDELVNEAKYAILQAAE